jgi:putative addiction module killer protein
VQSRPRDVLVYETEDGKVPFTEWLETLDGSPAYRRILARLDRLEEGNLGDHRSVGEGVIELRLDFGPGYRIYVGQDGETLVILPLGGTKRRQQADIETAQRYWRNYHA